MDPEGREHVPIRAGEASPPVITSTLMRERENPCRTLDKDEDKRLKTISNQKEDKSEFGPLVVPRSDGDRRGGAGDEGGTEGGRREDEWVSTSGGGAGTPRPRSSSCSCSSQGGESSTVGSSPDK